MEDSSLQSLVRAVQDVLRPRLQESEAARRLARLMGEWLIEEARAASGGEESAPEPSGYSTEPLSEGSRDGRAGVGEPVGADGAGTPPEDGEAVRARTPAPTMRRGIVPLKIGDAKVHIAVPGSTEDLGRARQTAPEFDDDEEPVESRPSSGPIVDLDLVRQRCRLKAESCRLFIERRAAEGDVDRERPLIDRMNAMIATAKSMTDCFLWVFWRERTQPDDATLRTIARCYDALEIAAAHTHAIVGMRDGPKEQDIADAMQQLAHAGSALRVSLERTWLTSADKDQEDVHFWLLRETSRRGVFVRRHMQLDDPADPNDAEGIIQRVRESQASVEDRVKRRARIEAGFNKIRYHARRIADSAEHPQDHDVGTIGEAAARLIEAGVASSDPRFVEVTPPEVARVLIERLDGPARAAMRAVVEAQAHAERDEADEPDTPRARSERVERVRRLLAGRRVVIIGGVPRPDAEQRIRDAFALEGIDWVRLTEHGTGEPMRAPIARPETALVLVLVKLAGHLHIDEARRYAESAGKPCVSITAGYNPEQIAQSVLEQASDRLTAVGAG